MLLAAAIALLCSLAPMLAGAGLPSPANSTVPAHVLLVGEGPTGAADPVGTLTCTVRRLDNTTYRQARVQFDFAETPDMEPSLVQPDPQITVTCSGGTRTVNAVADDNGTVTLRIVGRALRSTPDGAHSNSLRVFAEGVLMAIPTVSAFDQDGVGGVGPADLNDFLQDFFSGQYWARSDYDGNGSLGPGDLSAWLQVFFAANSVQSGSMAACP